MLQQVKKQAIIAGISLIIMAAAAGFAFGYAHSTLSGVSPDTTFQNLLRNKSLFYGEIVAWLIIFITDLIVSVALFHFFRPISKQFALLTAIVRIIYTLILGVAIYQLLNIIPNLYADNPGELQIASSTALWNQFEQIWSIGLIIFGFHLLGLGSLTIKSRWAHWGLGILLYIAGFSYIFVHATRQLNLLNIETISSIETVLAVPMALAEILLAIWLLYFGFKKNAKK